MGRVVEGLGFPFVTVPLSDPDKGVHDLFRKSFGVDAPLEPIHFVARPRGAGNTAAAYIHFIHFKPGIYLCGGLCVATSVYRTLSPAERHQVASVGSLSRWLSLQSIAALADKRAVFAYTGDTRSRRDARALGFEPAAGKYLFVQWHDAKARDRGAMIADVERLGPF